MFKVADIKTAEMLAVEAKETARLQAKADRDKSLSEMQHVLTDGSIVQVTPADLTNFQISIDKGATKDWVLKDNNVRPLTVVEMQECLASGISQGEAVWKTYTNFLKLN